MFKETGILSGKITTNLLFLIFLFRTKQHHAEQLYQYCFYAFHQRPIRIRGHFCSPIYNPRRKCVLIKYASTDCFTYLHLEIPFPCFAPGVSLEGVLYRGGDLTLSFSSVKKEKTKKTFEASATQGGDKDISAKG